MIIVSNGSVEQYRHPRAATLKTYAETLGPPVVFQTNKCFHPSPCANVPDQFVADLKPSSTAGTILVTVDEPSSTYTVTYGTQKHPFNTKALPPVAFVPTVIIDSLLPDPIGPDEQLEEVTLKTIGPQAVSRAGWKLRDRSGFDWSLSGSIAPGESRTFRRNGQRMSLNNNGDEIMLLNDAQVERDRFTYTSSREGVVIRRSP